MIALRAPQLLAALAAAGLAAACSAQEWTRLRGPKGQGHGAAELPAALTAKNVRWRVDVGEGHSSPVLWGDRVFLTRLGEDGASREVVCYDADTGALRWSKAFGFDPHDQHKLNNFAASTPAVDADGVYLLWTSGARLLARSLDHDGEPRWRPTSAPSTATTAAPCRRPVRGARDRRQREPGQRLLRDRLDRDTGEPRWRIDRSLGRWALLAAVPLRAGKRGARLAAGELRARVDRDRA